MVRLCVCCVNPKITKFRVRSPRTTYNTQKVDPSPSPGWAHLRPPFHLTSTPASANHSLNARFDEQNKKLIRSLALIVRNLEKPDYLKAYLGELGQMHVAYGTEEAHDPAVGECQLVALEKLAGSAWNDEIRQAWVEAYGVVAQMMIDGARMVGDQAPAAKESAA